MSFLYQNYISRMSNQIIVTNGSIRGMKGKISYFCLLK